MVKDAWNPEQYAKFAAEREQPFHDLMGMVRPLGPSPTLAVDLGCGPGTLTAAATRQLGVARMIGIDNSAEMLASADAHASATVHFEHGDIATWTSAGDHHLVMAHASLHWVPDHATVLARWVAALRPGGQLAVQVPANAYMPSHVVADELANSPPWRAAFGPDGPPSDPVADNVLEPEQYASLLYQLGMVDQRVWLQVYPHVLPSSHHVVQWVRGTTLTRFQRLLTADEFEAFVADYEAALLAEIGRNEPHFFPFRRILMWARTGG